MISVKEMVETYSILDFISVGILVTAVAMNTIKRLESCVRVYLINSLCLFLLVLFMAVKFNESHLYVAAFLTLFVKVFIIPYVLKKIIKDLKATHDVQPYLSNTLSLIITSILITTVYTSLSKGIFVSEATKNILWISVAVLLIGLFIMITRRKAIVQVLGLLFMENGLFLAGFSLTMGMPVLVELGILFDMLMGIIILLVFVVQIKRHFSSTDLDSLRSLKW